MAIEFLSIVVFTFALALLVLGAITWWIERGKKQTAGILMMCSALVIAGVVLLRIQEGRNHPNRRQGES